MNVFIGISWSMSRNFDWTACGVSRCLALALNRFASALSNFESFMYVFRFGFVTYENSDEAEKAIKEVTRLLYATVCLIGWAFLFQSLIFLSRWTVKEFQMSTCMSRMPENSFVTTEGITPCGLEVKITLSHLRSYQIWPNAENLSLIWYHDFVRRVKIIPERVYTCWLNQGKQLVCEVCMI